MKIPQPIQYMESQGTRVTLLSDDERNAFIEATRPLYDKWVPKIGVDLYEKAQADMDQ
ncbi:hypothetical protein D1AOALGA4SA_10196 [Olavius algarvensis Delta 1 endosymbiont]|nr:hypothetical protein D1AOALGA4SA_10196 [Olavius algarvensis Delta 1 endosymbiont]